MIREMDGIIEITDESSTDGIHVSLTREVKSSHKDKSDIHQTSIEIDTSDAESITSSPLRDRSKNSERLGINESMELNASFVDDIVDNSYMKSVESQSQNILSTKETTKKFKRTRSLLDDIREKYGYDTSSSDDSDDGFGFGTTDLTFNESNIIDANKRQKIIATIIEENLSSKSPPGKKIVSKTQEDIIVIDETESSTHPTIDNTSRMTIPSQDILRDFPMSSQIQVNGNIVPPNDLDPSNLATSSQNLTVKNIEASKEDVYIGLPMNHNDNIPITSSQPNMPLYPPLSPLKPDSGMMKKRKEANFRLFSRQKTKDSDCIDLNLNLFLQDDDDENGENEHEYHGTPIQPADRQDTTESEHVTSMSTRVVPPLQRSRTTGFRESDTPEQNNELADVLAKYIINGQNFTDEESQSMIEDALHNKKGQFRKVNQIYRDNQKAREYMIVEISKSLIDQFNKTNIRLDELLTPGELRRSYSVDSLPIIKFFRKCDSIYDFNHDYYYPEETKILEENVIMLFYDTKDFFDQYNNKKRELYKIIQVYAKQKKQVIIVLNEVNKFKKQIDVIEQQKYKEKVNEQLQGGTPSPTRPNRKKSKALEETEQLGLSVFKVDQRIRFIDRKWGCNIVTTNSTVEFIHALPNITTLIAKKRMDPTIRFINYAHINVKSGKDQSDTLRKVIHDIGRIPDLKAGSIVRTYPKFQELLQDFEKRQLRSDVNGNHLMPPGGEAKLLKLFMSRDPTETLPQ